MTLLPIVLWLLEVWDSGIFAGAGTALLTPLIVVALSVISLRGLQRSTSDVAGRWLMPAYIGASILALTVLIEPGVTSKWMFLIGLAWPIWLLSWIGLTFGYQTARVLLFPLLFLWFCLPFEPYLYDALDTPLQELTTDVAVVFLGWIGHPVQYWNAHTFYTDEFYIIVDETCSGMNMIVTLSMYALIFGWVTRHPLVNRCWMVLSVLPLALLSNGLRVAAIYLLGIHGGEELAKGFWHDGSGVVAFMPTLVGIYAVGELLRRFGRRRAKMGSANKTSAFTPE